MGIGPRRRRRQEEDVMKRVTIAVLLGLLASTIASADALQDGFVKRLGKYAASSANFKGTCVCQDGTAAAGYLFQSKRYPAQGVVEVVVQCSVQEYDANDNWNGTR